MTVCGVGAFCRIFHANIGQIVKLAVWLPDCSGGTDSVQQTAAMSYGGEKSLELLKKQTLNVTGFCSGSDLEPFTSRRRAEYSY